jgi:hypothetical protein
MKTMTLALAGAISVILLYYPVGSAAEPVPMSGRIFMAINVAVKELEQRGGKVEDYEIQYDMKVGASPSIVTVAFLDPDYGKWRGLGSSPNIPTIEVEVYISYLNILVF